jgi:hypothetical protein
VRAVDDDRPPAATVECPESDTRGSEPVDREALGSTARIDRSASRASVSGASISSALRTS